MNIQTETSNARIEREAKSSKLIIPYKDTELTFIHPFFGPGDYKTVGRQIEEAGLVRPTSEETAFLVHNAYLNSKISNEPEVVSIINITRSEFMKDQHLWEFTRNLWTAKGVYLYDNRDGEPKDEAYLIERLEEGDETVRFVHHGFKLGEQSFKEFENNPYIIARYGQEGAQKLAELVDKSMVKTYVLGLEEVSSSIQGVSSLYRFPSSKFNFIGISPDDNVGGYALGLLAS